MQNSEGVSINNNAKNLQCSCEMELWLGKNPSSGVASLRLGTRDT
ncbi:unnamed protein product [Meloidogyne enterolobii]|uniref:Uncharacterized protein n=1 Tax=Meloidogyne enterolobii TaxID=390850 RepID=A0ACB0Z813_MELEN